MIRQLFLTGGLGNQMFEYAFYLSCKKKGINIRLNRDMYEVNRMHNGYMLERTFGIPESEILPSNKFTVLTSRIMRRFCPKGLVYNENPEFFSEKAYTSNSPYINGAFMGERYFSDVVEEVKEKFSFVGIDNVNRCISKQMSKEDSVSLHIRRGDYLNFPQYAVCNEDYYTKAIMYIKNNVNNPKFYIFSDDPDWCKSFISKFEVNSEVISHNTDVDSYKDMYLMTQCKHNIIANSTFSWWGTWLNQNNNKIVVCPTSWIKGRTYNPCLNEWVKI